MTSDVVRKKRSDGIFGAARNVALAVVASAAICATGACSTVPEEAIQLSQAVGADVEAMQQSYEVLIRDYFNSLRAQRLQYLNEVWKPKYIAGWVADGRLKEVAAGKAVWSNTALDANGDPGAFVTPPTDRGQAEAMLLTTVIGWSEAALADIEDKRVELISGLDASEAALLKDVRSAFRNMSRANAAVTAHLSSLRDVQNAQDEALEAFDIKDLRDSINNKLVVVSNQAADGLEQVKKADGFLDKAEGFLDRK